MGRTYDTLECGCCISCDGGGGLVPCFGADSDCKAGEYIDEHKCCDVCGNCLVCFDHGCCRYGHKDFMTDVEMFLEQLIEDTQELLDKFKKI